MISRYTYRMGWPTQSQTTAIRIGLYRRDVAGGSYRMGDVAVTFAGAAASCKQALCEAGSPSDSLLAAIFGDCCIQK